MNFGTTGTTPTTYANATYSYDGMGRVNAVGDGNYAANYLYNDLNKLISTEIKSSSDVSVMTSSRSYDALHRLTNISTVNKSFAYGYNAKNQRESMTLADNSAWNYTYDNLGQVATGNLLDSTTQPVAGKQFAYNYDLIGNRTIARQGSDSAADLVNYTSNLVNQYAAINELQPAYDEDGNMISFNGWIRGYDAENRIIFEANSTDKFEYAYDYQNRRYESKHYLKNGENWVLNKTTRYTWDDWNIIAEHTLQDGVWALEKSYLWGVDLTASMDAAGGVGALISETNSTGTFFPYYDGNGNIMGYRDASGNLVAEFSYDPFLNVTAIVGNLSDFVYQASTKRFNPVTGSLSYQLRDYSPILGRWITRDPIEEDGGYNLYAMVKNCAIEWFDLIGLGMFTIWEDTIDLTHPNVSAGADTKTVSDGFIVVWTPSKDDLKKCPCPYLTQVFSTSGLRGQGPSIDASDDEKKTNFRSGGKKLPPQMKPTYNPKEYKYSYFDSPNFNLKNSMGIKYFTLTPAVICKDKSAPNGWKAYEVTTFEFSISTRKITAINGKKNSDGKYVVPGESPNGNDEWKKAENLWRRKNEK